VKFQRIASLLALWVALLSFFSATVSGQDWRPLGPQGGDVRSLSVDPQNAQILYIGTSDGHIFQSTNGGARWELVGRVGERQDAVVMTLQVDRRDSRRLFAGTQTLRDNAGGVYRSEDGGRSWMRAGLHGQVVRALAQSQSRPDLFVAGTLDGVYRSTDSGKSWQRISPAGHEDLRNFDSVAIDPQNPDFIYAGTYHLAWKTIDGGLHWMPIHSGMIDDSDVMDISIDPSDANRIFATACSGMYRSANRGDSWMKIRGVPPTARRTYFLRQDPSNLRVLYAGTTQGLWKSADDGLTWKRITPAGWSVIALVLDPKNPNKLVAGTERRGVFVSEDGGVTFRPSNQGFHHQQIMAFAADPENEERMLLVLTNAQERILTTRDGGRSWNSAGMGVAPEQIRRVFSVPGGWWVSLSSGGLMAYDEKKAKWSKAGFVAPSKTVPVARPGKRSAPPVQRPFQQIVNDLAYGRDIWLAATQQGVAGSRDRGATWFEFSAPEVRGTPALSVRASSDGRHFYVLTQHGLLASSDAGQSWNRVELPVPAALAVRLHNLDDPTLILASKVGLFVSEDSGRRWRPPYLPGMFIEDVAVSEGILLVSTQSDGLYSSTDRGESWIPMEGPVAGARFPFLANHRINRSFVAASSTESLHTLRIDLLSAKRTAQQAPSLTSMSQQSQLKPNQQ